ncbi:hypothetical protein KDN32_12530 [Nocardioides sp. J2M5]|uniref:hypothetical protein n=1 Tax=Nocardioides palaemonis TaxID=2829810 RepID=UPI001BADBDE5|nr:hypothetical protein [Nocardioides palaemonis]MBS2938567.1 hypothetical protein [Nocardioides palaemonis]
MPSLRRSTRVGGIEPLAVEDVGVHTRDDYQSGDPYKVVVYFNREVDDFEDRVFRQEFRDTGFSLQQDHIQLSGEFDRIDPRSVRSFLDGFNTRVAQLREEAAASHERLREQSEKLKRELGQGR